jgi:hypothetical protein
VASEVTSKVEAPQRGQDAELRASSGRDAVQRVDHDRRAPRGVIDFRFAQLRIRLALRTVGTSLGNGMHSLPALRKRRARSSRCAFRWSAPRPRARPRVRARLRAPRGVGFDDGIASAVVSLGVIASLIGRACSGRCKDLQR